MATVGSLTVKLGLNSAAFSSGRKQANKELKALSDSVRGIQGLITGGLAVLGASATIGAAKAFVGSQMQVIDATGKAADRLGIQTEALIAYRHAAGLGGVGSDEFDASLEKMTRNIGVAAQKTGAQRDAITALGLSYEDLAKMRPDESMAAIADQLKEIDNPAQRAAIVTDIFGRAGQKLQNTLMGGSAALQAAREETDRLGVSFTRVDAAKVEQANDAMFRAQEVVRGVGVQLAVGLSPFLTAATDQFIDMAASGGSVGDKVTAGLEMVATGVATVADYLELGKAGFYTLQGVATGEIYGIVEAVDLIGQGLTDLLNLIGVDAKWTSFAGQFADNLKEEMDNAFAAAGDSYNAFIDGKNGNKVKEIFGKIQADAVLAGQTVAAAATAPIEAIDHDAQQAADKIKNVLAGLDKDLAQFGMSAADKKLYDLKAMGASPEQLTQAKKAIDHLNDLQAAQKKQQDNAAAAKSIFDATRTPLEQYEAHIGKLSDLLADGALDWDTYTRAVREARKELEGGDKAGRSANLGERMALQARGASGGGSASARASAVSRGGQRAAGLPVRNGKLEVDGTDKTNELLESMNGYMERASFGALV